MTVDLRARNVPITQFRFQQMAIEFALCARRLLHRHASVGVHIGYARASADRALVTECHPDSWHDSARIAE